MSEVRPCAWLASPAGRGGIAIIDLEGSDESLESLIERLAPGSPIAPGQAAHRRIANIDDGLVLRLDESHAQIMPHGGIAIVRRIAEALQASGVHWCASPPPGRRFEARDRIEALALDTMSQAASPAAVQPLLRQADAWRRDAGALTTVELTRGRRLDRLVTPATIVCVGAPNAGKSSLLNALLASEASIVTDRPGTTRDRVSRHLDLSGVVVEWVDTPGLRETPDPIERKAIEASFSAIRTATVIVRLLAPDAPDADLPEGLAPQEGILEVRSKIDLGPKPGPELGVSVVTGEGIRQLAAEMRRRIVREDDLASPGRWGFCDELRAAGG